MVAGSDQNWKWSGSSWRMSTGPVCQSAQRRSRGGGDGEFKGVEERGGVGTNKGETSVGKAGLVMEGGNFYVVHDDVALQHGLEGGGGVGKEDKGVLRGEDVSVSLDAALGVQEEGVATLVGLERGDGVGAHAVEPADAVRDRRCAASRRRRWG